ncbi:MAG: hypothetical protein PF439_11820 [Helicobacteraceae bacterium]|jgi:hypothetical protein|nr:hypothetical protein [Helicobacteraceae bacterium]
MGDWFYRLLHYKKTSEPILHDFGRDINARINPQEHQLFNQAVEAFREGKKVEAFEYYLRSLENFNAGVSNENVRIHYEEEALHFVLYQGTAVVHGVITDKTFQANTVITSKALMNVAVKRHILERNELLTYVCYYTHSDFLELKLYLDNTTMTPQKIFYPLRELALNADYEKEYLHYHFKQERLTEVEHLQKIDENELRIKYDAMQKWIEECQEELTQLPANDNISTVSFTLLRLLFQIDYLLVPHKDMMQEIFEKVNSYFTDDERLVDQKNDELLVCIQTLQKLEFTAFSSQFYKAHYTFSPMEHTTSEELNQFIEGSLEKYRWFRQHRYDHVASTINRYIPLYILYNYGLHPSYRTLVHLLVEIQNSDFFVSLGYKPLYHTESKRFEKDAIVKGIDAAIRPYKEQFTHLKAFGKTLDYTTLEEFSHSFFLHLKNLNYTER